MEKNDFKSSEDSHRIETLKNCMVIVVLLIAVALLVNFISLMEKRNQEDNSGSNSSYYSSSQSADPSDDQSSSDASNSSDDSSNESNSVTYSVVGYEKYQDYDCQAGNSGRLIPCSDLYREMKNGTMQYLPFGIENAPNPDNSSTYIPVDENRNGVIDADE